MPRPRNETRTAGSDRIGAPLQLEPDSLEPPVDLPSLAPKIEIRPGASSRGRQALAAAQQLIDESQDEGSPSEYRKKAARYIAWAKEANLPWWDVNTVMAYIGERAVGARDEDGDLILDGMGKPIQSPLVWSTLKGDLAAIDHLFRSAGLSPLNSHPQLKRFRKLLPKRVATRRTKNRRPLARAHIDTLADRLLRPDLETVRDHAAITLRKETPMPLTFRDLIALNVEDIELHAESVKLGIGRPGGKQWIEIKATGASNCPVAAIRALIQRVAPPGSPDGTPVFTRVDGDGEPVGRLAHSGLHAAVTRRLQATSSREVDLGNALSIGSPSLIDIRDRALILLGIASSSRASNLCLGRWSDLEDDPPYGLKFVWRTSKTKIGPHPTAVPYGSSPGGPTCPVGAIAAWRKALRAELARVAGRGRRFEDPEEPIFCVIHNGKPKVETCNEAKARGRVGVSRCDNCKLEHRGIPTRQGCTARRLVPLTPEDVNNLVIKRVTQCGIDPTNIGSHSLRVTFSTLAHQGGASVFQIQAQTGHESIESLAGYIHTQALEQFNTAKLLGL